VPANRDFELNWNAAGDNAAGDAPSLGLFRQSYGDFDYVMATITSPATARVGDIFLREMIPSREMIFVIDNSGSMAGPDRWRANPWSLRAAACAPRLALCVPGTGSTSSGSAIQ
jgi:Ca-activated chloride channel family protein